IINSSVRQNGLAPGVQLEESPTNASGMRVKMVRPTRNAVGLEVSSEPSSSFSHLAVSGTWTGTAMESFGADLALTDSTLVTGGASTAPALWYDGQTGNRGLLLQRTLLQAAPGASADALQAERANATLDSSEVLGGKRAVFFQIPTAVTH